MKIKIVGVCICYDLVNKPSDEFERNLLFESISWISSAVSSIFLTLKLRVLP